MACTHTAAMAILAKLDVAPKLTTEDLKDLRVSIVGHRRVLLDAIADLRSETKAGPAPSEPPAPIATPAKDTRCQTPPSSAAECALGWRRKNHSDVASRGSRTSDVLPTSTCREGLVITGLTNRVNYPQRLNRHARDHRTRRPVEIANSHLFVSRPKTASVSPESSAVTVAGNNNNTAPATHGALRAPRRPASGSCPTIRFRRPRGVKSPSPSGAVGPEKG